MAKATKRKTTKRKRKTTKRNAPSAPTTAGNRTKRKTTKRTTKVAANGDKAKRLAMLVEARADIVERKKETMAEFRKELADTDKLITTLSHEIVTGQRNLLD